MITELMLLNTYSVYYHVNRSNRKVYVGITARPPKQRWGSNGSGYQPKKKGSSPFYNAILKYGWDNFDHVVMYTGLSKREAEMMEIDLIATFNSDKRQYGYNIEHGGNAHGRLTYAQRQAIHESWMDPVARAERIAKISRGKTGKSFSAEHRKHLSESRKGRFKGRNANNARAIDQLDMDGNYIRSFGALAEARDELGIGSPNLCRALKTGGTCGGYRWRYSD